MPSKRCGETFFSDRQKLKEFLAGAPACEKRRWEVHHPYRNLRRRREPREPRAVAAAARRDSPTVTRPQAPVPLSASLALS